VEDEKQLLKDKAFLLLRRERELNAMRVKHERLGSWLRLTQSLPALIAAEPGLDRVCGSLRRALLAGLGTQRVTFFLVEEASLQALGLTPAPPVSLSPAGAALVGQTRSGVCNARGTDPALGALCDAVGLERFIWTRIETHQGRTPPLLLVAGYARDKAGFQPPFGDDEAAHLENMGQHIAVLLRNKDLVSELERDKARLQTFNEDLEHRVAERTKELARVNESMARALASLEDKDRRLDEDLREARHFQQSILAGLPQRSPIAFEAVFRPLDVVGGDVYDVCEILPGVFRAFMADATGHGVQASLRTIVLKSEYDRLKTVYQSPRALLDAFNERLCAMFPRAEMLSTGCCFDVDLRDPAAPKLRYANAAHPPLLHVSAGRVREIDCDGTMLGVPSQGHGEGIEIALHPGDLLIVASDGVWDQVGGAAEGFDLARVVGVAADGAGAPSTVLTAVLDEMDRFRGDQAIADDITVLSARLADDLRSPSVVAARRELAV